MIAPRAGRVLDGGEAVVQRGEPRAVHARGQPQVVFGVAEEVLTGLRGMNALSPPVRFTAVAVVFDPETAKRVLDELDTSVGC